MASAHLAYPPIDLSTHPFEIITFAPNDPEDPHNWSARRKRNVVAYLCVVGFCSAFGSATYAAGEEQLRISYGVGPLTTSSGLTLYVIGLAFGPLLWGPLSEIYGRKFPYMIAQPLVIVFTAMSGFVQNIVVIVLFRFFAGFAASCALVNGTGIIADMYSNNPMSLGQAIAYFALPPLTGPCWGFVVGFFIAAHSPVRQLWVVRIHFFFALACWPLVFWHPETYGPTIVLNRAKRYRAAGNLNARAPQEIHTQTSKQVLQGHIFRPMRMLLTEPIVQGGALWSSIAYSMIYFFFEMYPQVFIVQHGIAFQLCGLFFIPISFGMIFALLPYRRTMAFLPRIHIPYLEQGRGSVDTAKLKFALFGCIFMPISLFWFAWSSGSETHWAAPMFSGLPFGYSVFVLFLSLGSYSSQTFTVYATSASAAMAFTRAVTASMFPLVAHPIINNMGTKWGVSLFAFISLGCLAVPVLFIRYSQQLIAQSPHAKEANEVLRKLRRQAQALLPR